MHRENHATLRLPCTSTANGYSTTTQVKRKKKKKNAINLFLCFRSFDVIVPENPGQQHPRDVFSYVAVGEKEDMAYPKVVQVTSSLSTFDNEADDEKCHGTQQRKQGRCGFSQVLKAVLFKTSLVKKTQKGQIEKNFANTKNECSTTSTYDQEWLEEDLPKMISKKTSYVSLEEKEDVVFPKVLPMASPVVDNQKNEEKCDGKYQRKKGRCQLSRVFKAVLFETSLATKIRKRKKVKKIGRNESSMFNQELFDTASLTNNSILTTSSVNSSSSSSLSNSSNASRSLSKRIKSFRSSSSRSLKANLRYLSGKIRSNSNISKANSRSFANKNKSFETYSNGLERGHGQDQNVSSIAKNKKKGCYRSIVSLCFLLMSLLGLIFYGKICAILCTSMWLCSVPLWTSVGDGSTNKVDKKKFIIGGLLARDTRTIRRQ